MRLVKLYPKTGDVYLITFDPTNGSEIKKSRPCVIISPNEMNKYLKIVIVAPLTSTIRDFPFRVNLEFQNRKGQVMIDQIRSIDKSRLIKCLGYLDPDTLKI